MFKKIVLYLLIASFSFSLTACGEFNLFGWVHKKGSSSDKDVLISDGEVALIKKDYNDAKNYFEKVLDKDPNNSVALYGYARATLGASGLGLADVISAVIQQASASPSSASLPSIVTQGEFANLFYSTYASSGLEDLLPDTLNLKLLYDTAKGVIPKLKKIADGEGDGKIPADDVDVNVNLAILLAIRAACGMLDTNGDGTPGGTGDILEVYSDYSVKLPTQDELDTLTPTEAQISSLRDAVQHAIWDIIGGGTSPYDKGAVDYLLVAINKIGAGSGSALSDLKNNINDLEVNSTEGIAALKDIINDYITDKGYDIEPIS